MLYRFKHLLIILFFFLVGCEKDVKNAMVPDFVPKLVVTSFISPANRINKVIVTSNNRIFGDLGIRNPAGNLSGWISDGNNEIPLHLSNGKLIFSQDEMKIEAGKEYAVRVVNDSGLEARGKCQVPENYDFHLDADTLFTLKYGNGFEWSVFTLRVTFLDQPGIDNYYRVNAKYIIYYKHDNSFEKRDVMFEKDTFTDASFNTEGKVITETTLMHPGSYIDSAFLKIYLFNTERSYYLYHKSLNDYSADNNPFREASPVYTNIEGGLGIITSYTCDSLIFRVK